MQDSVARGVVLWLEQSAESLGQTRAAVLRTFRQVSASDYCCGQQTYNWLQHWWLFFLCSGFLRMLPLLSVTDSTEISARAKASHLQVTGSDDDRLRCSAAELRRKLNDVYSKLQFETAVGSGYRTAGYSTAACMCWHLPVMRGLSAQPILLSPCAIAF